MSSGERIAEYRTKQHMSQNDLADALDVSRQSVSKWETDASVPELEKLVQLCDIFGVSMDVLVRGKVCGEEETIESGGNGPACSESVDSCSDGKSGICAWQFFSWLAVWSAFAFKGELDSNVHGPFILWQSLS